MCRCWPPYQGSFLEKKEERKQKASNETNRELLPTTTMTTTATTTTNTQKNDVPTQTMASETISTTSSASRVATAPELKQPNFQHHLSYNHHKQDNLVHQGEPLMYEITRFQAFHHLLHARTLLFGWQMHFHRLSRPNTCRGLSE